MGKNKYCTPTLIFLSFNESDVLTASPVNGYNDKDNYFTDPDADGGLSL